MKTTLLLLLLAISLSAHADQISRDEATMDSGSDHSHSSFIMGHNLTPTSYTPEKGQVIAGFYSLLYGVTDQFMIGTSPWMIFGYNMPMVNFKYSFTPPAIFDHASMEFMYFKTAEMLFNAYHQESTWWRLTGTFDVSKSYAIHTCFGAQYFMDDLVPFSMRPPPLNGTPITLSLSALQEIRLTDHWGTFLESGLLGFNYPNRYLHLGASGFYKWASGYVQLGLSKTFMIGPEYLDRDYINQGISDDHFWYANGRYTSSIYYSWPQPIHPELHIEFVL